MDKREKLVEILRQRHGQRKRWLRRMGAELARGQGKGKKTIDSDLSCGILTLCDSDSQPSLKARLDFGRKGMKWGQHIFGDDNPVGIRLSKKEYAGVAKAINTYFHGRFSSRIGKKCGIAIGNQYYLFQNDGFDDFKIIAKLNLGMDREVIDYFERRIQNGD